MTTAGSPAGRGAGAVSGTVKTREPELVTSATFAILMPGAAVAPGVNDGEGPTDPVGDGDGRKNDGSGLPSTTDGTDAPRSSRVTPPAPARSSVMTPRPTTWRAARRVGDASRSWVSARASGRTRRFPWPASASVSHAKP